MVSTSFSDASRTTITSRKEGDPEIVQLLFCNVTGQFVTCDLPDIPVGEETVLTLNVTAPDEPTNPTLINSAEATASNDNSPPAPAEATTTVSPVSITKTADARTVEVGEEVTYTITWTTTVQLI